ncbi:MAG: hypothetical protein Q4C49_12820 [Bacillota bacterium]|nr:hypothetical protein [Bacillota bacterium]
MLNLTQHNLTPNQILDGVIEPEDKEYIRSLLTIDHIPSEEELISIAQKISDYAASLNASSAMIGGAMYLMPYLVFELNKRNIEAYYSFSKRVSRDILQEDGTVKKEIFFNHSGFVKATLPK